MTIVILPPPNKCPHCNQCYLEYIDHVGRCQSCHFIEGHCNPGSHRWKSYRSFDGEQHHIDVSCEDCGLDYNEGT